MNKLTPEEIAKIIDPDNTFLEECENVIKWKKFREKITKTRRRR